MIGGMQNFDNHVHRPVGTSVGGLFVIVALVAFVLRWFETGGRVSMAIGLAGVLAALMALLTISRTYTTRLQDRIIKLEMRIRAASVLSPEHQRLLFQCDNKQIAALRFASDAELAALVERAAREKMKPGDIKRAVKNWVGDFD